MANQHNLWHEMTAPHDPDPDIARREYMTKVALIVISAVSISFALIGLIGWIAQVIPADTLGILVLMSLFFSGGWWLASQGHWRVSGYIPPAFMFLAAAYGNYIGGVDAPAMLMYALTIILVAVLQGHRLQWGALALCLIAYLGIGVAHAQGYLTPLRSAETAFANRITIASATMIAIAALVWFLSTQYERALCQSHALAEEAQTYAHALQEKTAELDRFFSSAIDLLCIADTNGYFRRLNKEWENTLGYSLEELQGHKFLDFVHPDDVAETAEAASHLTSQKEILNFTNRYRCRDGSYRWIEWRSVPYGDRIYAAARDITERKKVELALRTSQERFQGLVENLSDWVWEVNVQGAYTYVSPKVKELLGYDPQELLGKTPFDLMPPEEVKRVVPALGQLMAERLPVRALENTNVHKDGHLVIFETNGTPFFDEKGNLLGYRGADRDITERKRAEKQLQESEEKFRQIISRSLVGMYRSTPEGQLLECNPAMLRIMGFDSVEAVNVVGLSHCYADPQDRVRLWNLAQQGPVSGFETQYRRPDGTLVDVAISGSLIHDEKGNLLFLEGTFEDITARKQVEAGLQRERELFVGGPVAVFKWVNAEGWPVEYASPNLKSFIGYPAEDLLSGAVPYPVLIHPDDLTRVAEEVKTHTEEGRTSFEQEYRMVRADGEVIWVYDFTAIIRNERGRATHYDGYIINITDRKQIEETLKESEVRFRTLFEAMTEGVALHELIYDEEGKAVDYQIFDANPAYTTHTGIPVETVLGKQSREIYGSDLPPYFETFSKVALTGEPLLLETYFLPLGKHFRISIISPKQGQFATVFEDITESKLRQQELEARNAEMERFTYTVSHDLRSPLITIKGFSGALEQDMATGREDRIKSDLQRIINAADKMDILLSGLLELSRIGRVVNPPSTISMDALMREVLSLLAGPIAQRGVEVQVQPDLPTIYGDKQRMLEVMQNLIENAIKYMGEQPQPRIEIGVRDEDEAPVFFVRDNGIGIEPRYHQTIFGLFEKLDPKAEGTGIGLALVKRIIETHGGKIWVESEGKGQGATFCFTLPPAQ